MSIGKLDATTHKVLKRKARVLKRLVDRFVRREAQLLSAYDFAASRLLGVMPTPLRYSNRLYVSPVNALLLRYLSPVGAEPGFSVAYCSSAVEHPLLPTPQGDVAFTMIRLGEGASVHCKRLLMQTPLGMHVFERVSVWSIASDDPRFNNPELAAIVDFQKFVLGLMVQSGDIVASATTVVRLRELIDQYRSLLAESSREEQLQVFLKEHPLLLGPCTMVIPKQKLGDDFVTDFCLQRTTSAGYEYTLVEIERASHQLFTRNGDQTAQLTHAIGQLHSWQGWLEKNQAYLRNKLPDFESPQLRVIIGRAQDLTEEQRGKLRVMNRHHQIRVLTYDDLVSELERLIAFLGSEQRAA